MATDSNRTISANVRAEAAALEITWSQLADKAGMSPNTLYRRLNGKRPVWQAGEVLAVSVALGMTLDSLYAERAHAA